MLTRSIPSMATLSTTSAPQPPQIGNRRVDPRTHLPKPFRIRIHRPIHRIADDPDSGARQPTRVEAVGIRIRNTPEGARGHRIVGIVAGDDPEQDGRIHDGAGHRAHGVGGGIGGHQAEAPDQLQRGTQTDQRRHRGRTADRPAGVLADADHSEVGATPTPVPPDEPLGLRLGS